MGKIEDRIEQEINEMQKAGLNTKKYMIVFIPFVALYTIITAVVSFIAYIGMQILRFCTLVVGFIGRTSSAEAATASFWIINVLGKDKAKTSVDE